MNKTYVVGHKNPDTDSICSAIAFAELKNKTTGSNSYQSYRAGSLNEETQFVLKKIGLKQPPLLQDLRPQVSDLEIKEVSGVKSDLSIKRCWKLMTQAQAITLPIVKGKKLEGIITITDIAESYMDIYDNNVLAKSQTSYKQIAETLDGKIIGQIPSDSVATGKVFTAVATPETMENYVEQGDTVILGNRYESQLCAIELGAGCIIVCEKAPISLTISKLARENGCVVISTPHDAFTASRLIYQSVPIGYVMKSEGIISFSEDDYIEDVRKIMAEKRHRDFPILDAHDNYIGMISRRNLLKAHKKKVILVDHNEGKQAVNGVFAADIIEIVDHHRLGTLETISPVSFRNSPVGCTATIIYDMYKDAGVEIDSQMAYLMCSAIISDTLMFKSPTCTELDIKAGKQLARIAGIDIETHAREMFFAGSNISEKTAKELFLGDYKKFSFGEISFGIGQVSCIDAGELLAVRKKIYAYMKEQYKNMGMGMLFFMLTDMMAQNTELLCVGEGAEELVENAFGVTAKNGGAMLLGVVSRKKQVVPELMMAIGQ